MLMKGLSILLQLLIIKYALPSSWERHKAQIYRQQRESKIRLPLQAALVR